MTELTDKSVIVTDPEKIKQLVRVGAIEQECEHAEIPLLEAAYWVEKGILDISKDKVLDALRKTDKLAEERYKILKHLMDLGFIVRASIEGEYLRVHDKGIKRGEDRTKYLLAVVPSDWTLKSEETDKLLEAAGKVRKELLIGTVDKDGVSFLKIARKKF